MGVKAVSHSKRRIPFDGAWNQVLTRICRPKWKHETGGWRKLHTEEFVTCTLHKLLDQTKNEMDGTWSAHKEKRNQTCIQYFSSEMWRPET
jgi:hypothetical protein